MADAMEPESSKPNEAVPAVETHSQDEEESGSAFRRALERASGRPRSEAEASVRVTLEGDLAGFPPADVVQWVAAGPGDSILVASCGPGYRFRFHRGRLVAAGRGRLGEDFLAHLLRYQHLSTMEANDTREGSRRLTMPVALAAFELRLLERPRQVLAEYALEVMYDFLQETSGTFFVAPPVTEYPSVLATDTDPAVAVLKGLHRLDEERALGAWLPQPGNVLVWRESIAEALGESTIPLAGRIERLLQEGPATLEAVVDQLGVETHAARIALAHLHRSGYLEVRPAASPARREDESALAPEAVSTHGGRFRFVSGPTPDQAVFFTELEARCLKALHAEEGSPEELSQRLAVSSGVMEQVVAELVRQGLLDGVSSGRLRRLPLRWAVAAALGGLTLGALWLALSAGGSWVGGSSARRGVPVAESSVLPPLELRRPSARPEVPITSEPAPPKPAEPERVPEVPEATASEPAPAVASAAAVPPVSLTRAEVAESARRSAPQPALVTGATPPARSAGPASRSGAAQPARPPKAKPAPRVPVGAEFESAVGEALPIAPPEVAPVLPPAPGTLVINAVPFGYVRVNGKEHGVTPVRLTIESGVYTVEIYREGYVSQSRRVSIEPERSTAISFAVEVESQRGGSDAESAPP